MIGLNPSTADDRSDDPTNRRLIGLLSAHGFGGYWLINLIPESTPYPDRLGKQARRLSSKNQLVIHETATTTDTVILAWGAGATRCPFRYGLVESFIDPQCFGVTQQGEPRGNAKARYGNLDRGLQVGAPTEHPFLVVNRTNLAGRQCPLRVFENQLASAR